eukprot:jgi/Chlat1/2783/Chrsp187S02915
MGHEGVNCSHQRSWRECGAVAVTLRLSFPTTISSQQLQLVLDWPGAAKRGGYYSRQHALSASQGRQRRRAKARTAFRKGFITIGDGKVHAAP